MMTSLIRLLFSVLDRSAAVLSSISYLFPVNQRSASYGEHVRNGIDIYEPKGKPASVLIIVFFYGGRWTSGSREEYRFVGAAMARKGYRVYVPDYRLYPSVDYAGILSDASSALSSIIARESADARIVLMGHSAGAQIAVSLGSLGHRKISGVVAISTPYDSGRASAAATLPPLLAIAASDDKLVSHQSSVRLVDDWKIRGPAHLVVYPRGGHALLVGAISPIIRWTVPVMRDVQAFLTSVKDS